MDKHVGLIAGFGVGATLSFLLDSKRNAQQFRASPNHQLAATVCAELDEEIEHAKGIQVFADDNEVTLRGVALRQELPDVLSTARSVDGVLVVNNEIQVRDTPGNVHELQS
jgi:osmotically-inducible protein OsmY